MSSSAPEGPRQNRAVCTLPTPTPVTSPYLFLPLPWTWTLDEGEAWDTLGDEGITRAEELM